MLATRSEADTRTCRGPCGETFPLGPEHFNSAGSKLDGSPKYRSRCRRCMKAAQDAHRDELRRLGLAVNATPAERKPMLPAKPLGDLVEVVIEREAHVRGETKTERYKVLEARGGPSARSVYAWQRERARVEASTAAEALDALGLHLIDAYPQAMLDRVLPPVLLD